MRISELLISIASWLESPNNEALLLSETDEQCSSIVANSCVLAAELLKSAAIEVDLLEAPIESTITADSIEEMATLASALDSSNDPALKKQASVLDELLLTIAAPKFAERKDLSDDRLKQLQKLYQDTGKNLKEVNMIAKSEEAIKKSNYTKNFNIYDRPLNTRYCPDHSGVPIARVGQGIWQCEMDHKQYNFETGYELNDGTKVPGGDVSLQTQYINVPTHSVFDTREGRLQSK